MTLISTIHGALDDSLLEKREPEPIDNENETTTVIEYWLNGELVHRSVAIRLKKVPEGIASIVQDLA